MKVLPQGQGGETVGVALARHAQGYLRLASNAASALLGLVVLAVLGLNPLPASFPLITLARATPWIAVALGIFLIGLLIAFAVRIRWDQGWSTRLPLGPAVGRFFYTTVTSAVGSAIIGLLFGFAAFPSDIPA